MSKQFSKLINRFHTNSLKWDIKENELAMWVADMDFETAPEIIKALQRRVTHGIFGYNVISDEYFNAYINWWKKRHHYEMKKEWMMFCTGVVPAISSIVRKMTTVGENVLIQSPVYNVFYNSILNNGRNVLSSDLEYDGKEYHINFDDLEYKLSLPQTTLMILCNPHNPIGKIWDKETLKRIGDLCIKHHVLVVSDEIHCDIVSSNEHYIPFASVSKNNMMNSLTCISSSKAFNLAGLQSACIVVPNELLRNKVNRAINTDEVAEANSFAQVATITAFNECEYWIHDLCTYIESNKRIANEYIDEYLPMLSVVAAKASYLLWIDCSNICENTNELTAFIQKSSGLIVNAGAEYGDNGKRFIRMNVACPKDRVQDGLTRLHKSIIDFIQM